MTVSQLVHLVAGRDTRHCTKSNRRAIQCTN